MRIRYYKDDSVKFFLNAMRTTTENTYDIIWNDDGKEYKTIKDILKRISSDKTLMEYIKTFPDNVSLVITMERDESIERTGSKDCILYYCSSFGLNIDTNLKPVFGSLKFIGINDETGYDSAEIDFINKEIYYGSGPSEGVAYASAKVYFELVCEQKDLSEYILKHPNEVNY